MTDSADAPQAAPGLVKLWMVALFPALNICLFVPARLYLDNSAEFGLGLASLLLPLLAVGVLVALALAILLRLLPAAARRIAISLLFALGLLLWFQAAFLMYDYGALDGRGIDWPGFGSLARADLLLWLAVLCAALFLARPVARIAVFGSAVSIGVQLLPLLGAVDHFRPDSADLATVDEVPAGALVYSSGQNIVHVVLDNFQSDVFLELIEELGLERKFDGFVVYPENSTISPQTSLALPAMVSGRLPDGGNSPADYYQSAMSQSFQGHLFEAGFRVNMLPMLDMSAVPASFYHPVPNVYTGRIKVLRRQEVARLVDVSLFRQLPHQLRQWVHAEGNWRVTPLLTTPGTGKSFEQRRFLTDYIDGIEISHDGPAYHFMHLWPPHPPFSTDASGQPAGRVLPNTRANYVNEARPMVRLLAGFIDRIKALGVYDDALIIFQSDHGGGFEPDHMPRRLLGLMAIKPPGSSGPLRQSPVQSSLIDVPATVLEQAGLEPSSGPGQSILSMSVDDRLRHFVLMYKGSLHGLTISGSVQDPQSFGSVEQLATFELSRAYQPGEQAVVGLVGEGGRYLDSGWSHQEDRLVWSRDREATLLLELPPVENDLKLHMRLIPHVHPVRLPIQRIGVEVNGRLAGEWRAEKPGGMRIEARLPADWLDRPETEIRFLLPDAASQYKLGTGGDRRLLGMALVSFSLTPAAPATAAQPET